MTKELLPVWELMRTAHVVGLRYAELCADLGLTPTQFGILQVLDAHEGLTQAELARRVLVRPQSIGVLVTTLIDQGLVVRDGPGGRGRRTGMSLTDAGRRALQRCWPAVRDFNDPAALGLSTAEASTLMTSLDRIRSTLGPTA